VKKMHGDLIIGPGPSLWRALRNAGFHRTYKGSMGQVKLVEYKKSVGSRRVLNCQVWYDGLLRISSEFLGCSNTAPTVFKTLRELEKAIEFESTRMDGQYAKLRSCRVNWHGRKEGSSHTWRDTSKTSPTSRSPTF
jgi:hypothetical protein